jgi:CheY-like chemotaxis protein
VFDVLPRTRVLVVDDTPEVARRLERFLADLSQVDVAGSVGCGATALALIEAQPPDVVLLDVRMPPPDGLEVLRRIRAAGLRCGVIMMTSHPEPSIRERCFELGGDAFLDKSRELDRLSDLIGEAASYQRR